MRHMPFANNIGIDQFVHPRSPIRRLLFPAEIICVTSWENPSYAICEQRCANQPAHSRRLISAFVVRCLESITPIVALTDISGLYLASVAVQTDLSLFWLRIPWKTGFLMTWLSYNTFTCYAHNLQNSFIHSYYVYRATIFEPQHDKTNKMTCASREDSVQPAQLYSLIRVFAVRSVDS